MNGLQDWAVDAATKANPGQTTYAPVTPTAAPAPQSTAAYLPAAPSPVAPALSAPRPTATAAPTLAPTPAPAPAPPQAPTSILSRMQGPSGYTAQQRTFDEARGSVAGRVDSILTKGGPLMERARALATQQAASRGLINSSMAAEAGTAAMIDKSSSIAAQDAQAFNATEADNMSAANTGLQYSASEQNRFALQGNDQTFNSGESALNREAQTRENQLARDAQSRESEITRANAATEAQKIRDFQGDQFDVTQINAFKQQAQAHANTLEQMGLQSKLATAQVPAAYAAELVKLNQERIAGIMSDQNLDSAKKPAAIANLNDVLNANLSWAEKFYGVAIPRLAAPTAPGP